MVDYGIKISQDGFDVKTCADKDLVMSSKFNALKTKATGSSSVAVAHGLSYTPIFFTTRPKSAGQSGFIGDDSSNCDATNLNVYGTTRYYIFYQQSI